MLEPEPEMSKIAGSVNPGYNEYNLQLYIIQFIVFYSAGKKYALITLNVLQAEKQKAFFYK